MLLFVVEENLGENLGDIRGEKFKKAFSNLTYESNQLLLVDSRRCNSVRGKEGARADLVCEK